MHANLEAAPAALPAAPPIDPAAAARDRLVIGLLLVSTFVVILNETIMAVAIPRLMHDLAITASAAQWLTTAFLLTMAVVIPITGFLIQRLNTRPVFLLAMATFSAGTLLCALAPGLAWLVLGRVVQAVGTAIMLPLLMTTVMTLVPPATRGKTMGDISIVISVAPAIGPTISGLILSALDWRWMFWLVLPIALASLGLGWRFLTNVSEPHDAPIDFASVPLAALGFGGVVYGLSALGEAAGAPGPVPGPVALGVGAAALAVFGARQLRLQREDRALLDLRTLGIRDFAVAAGLMALCMISLFGTFILLPIYLQHVRGLDTLQTGLLMLPGGLVMGLLAPPVGRFYDRHGPRRLVVPGTTMVAAVGWWMATLGEGTPVAAIVAAHVVLSVGLALTFTPVFTAGLGALPSRLYAHGSAMVGTVQQVAGAAGAALFVALMSREAARLVAAGAPQVAATAGGVRAAFLVGAILSTLAVVAACFVRKPAEAAPPHA